MFDDRRTKYENGRAQPNHCRDKIMQNLRAVSFTGFMLLSFEARSATFSGPSRGAVLPSLCAQDSLIAVDAADERSSWAFRCGHLDRIVWQPIFTAVEGRRSYPVFAKTDGAWAIHRPDYGSCTLPTNVSFYEVCENGTAFFDGTTEMFGAGQTWDISDSNVTAWDNGQVIRFAINNVNYWGAAAYVFHSDYSLVDLSVYSKLHLQIKNSGYGAALGIQVFLVDMDGHAESVRLPATITRSYQDVVINLDQLELNGFPLQRTQALVIGISESQKQSYLIDIKKISAD